MLMMMETQSVKELNAQLPLSYAEREARLDWLEEIRATLLVKRRIVVALGDELATRVTFQLSVENGVHEADRALDKLARVLHVAGFADQQPLLGWNELDVTDLAVRDPDELARLLKTAMVRSGQGSGQLSKKTGIHRSQVYLLTNPGRGSLPRNSQQIRVFLRACRVPPHQVHRIIEQWYDLHRSRSVHKRH